MTTTEMCIRDRIVDSDDPQGRNSDGEQLVRCIEHTQKYLWDSFKAEESDEGEAEGNQHTELDRLEHTFSDVYKRQVQGSRSDL